ncbi:MAG: potassium-transporting ATPase subunit KdpA [Firmicutes bacterium]|uniref:Potassium-transporting ATPase potassium-binding subunit n=1 Tax=Sulfobacillus benefaciens TaxID=453960 RepID=A0A2T2WUE2_9FIRM|nr:potassium-transporting ATPase subunit KdpA [Bacillota bacterium]MCL5013245.1 potassium-transporting ATPase subunit KdpA [Bacillota bacterium]PSR25854.1 MAG: potassium-transporting ATPase subunit KdpA [Sulfobacillus benefaciens]
MTVPGVLGILVFVVVLILIAKPIGLYLYAVYDLRKTWLDPLMRPLERLVYRISGVNEDREMRWTEYFLAILAFNLIGFVVLYVLLRIQAALPFNPAHMKDLGPHLSFNTAVSFMTNTNWQAYGGESTMSYFSQAMLMVQQFLSPITGMGMILAFIRGLSRRNANTLGNFWVDLTRTLLWVSLPFAFVAALVLIALGNPQNWGPYITAHTLQGGTQIIAQGPVGMMNAIMQLGDNGGGFFNMNAGHPYETASAASLMFQLILGFSIPVGLTYYFGKVVKDTRQGWTILGAMLAMFLAGTLIMYHAEAVGNPLLAHLGIHGPNMEGKEVRFGPALSSLFETSTTAVSWGSTAAANDSLTPVGGLVTLFNMMSGEVIIGAWGVGLLGMLAFAILAVFLAGLMVGRTPEYLGKKIQSYEVKMAVLALIVPTFVILGLSAWAVVSKGGLAGIYNPGPHGLSEVLYAFSSGVGNNGSAFGGLDAASPFYTWTVGLAMLFGRFAMYIPALAIAGSLVRKQAVPESAGTFPTHGVLFAALLIATVIIVGALVFFPALALGPLAEHFALWSGHLFGGGA